MQCSDRGLATGSHVVAGRAADDDRPALGDDDRAHDHQQRGQGDQRPAAWCWRSIPPTG